MISLAYSFFNFVVQWFTFIQYHYYQFEKKHWVPFYIKYIGDEPQVAATTASHQYVKDGNVDGKLCDTPPDHDFVLYTSGTNCKICSLPLPMPLVAEVSNVKFISVEIEMNGKQIPLKLSEDGAYNYYVVGNILNSIVIQFILTKHYRKECIHAFGTDVPDFKNNTYKLYIIDNDVNMLTLTSDQSIKIGKDEYVVV